MEILELKNMISKMKNSLKAHKHKKEKSEFENSNKNHPK